MAKIGLRRHGEMLREVLRVLDSEDEGLPAREVLARVEERLELTPHELGHYPGGQRRFEKIVRFSTISSVKAGWLVKSKGHWTVTEDGKNALAEHTNPEDLIRAADQEYRKWHKMTRQAEDGADDEPEEAEASGSVLEEAEETAWKEISEYIASMPPADLEKLVGALVEAMGYHVLWIATGGADGGIDVIAFNDPLGTTSPRIKIQVKRRADKINSDGLRSFLALLHSDDVGIFVSTGGFTRDAQREARAQENRKVTLIGMKDLFDLWVEHYDRIPHSEKRLLPLASVHYLDVTERI